MLIYVLYHPDAENNNYIIHNNLRLNKFIFQSHTSKLSSAICIRLLSVGVNEVTDCIIVHIIVRHFIIVAESLFSLISSLTIVCVT